MPGRGLTLATVVTLGIPGKYASPKRGTFAAHANPLSRTVKAQKLKVNIRINNCQKSCAATAVQCQISHWVS